VCRVTAARLNDGRTSPPQANGVSLGSGATSFRVTESRAVGDWGIDVSNPRYRVDVVLTPTRELALALDRGVYYWNTTFRGEPRIGAARPSAGTIARRAADPYPVGGAHLDLLGHHCA
jgi:hypothetical protein